MSLLGKYMPHPTIGSGSWGDANDPLDAGRWTMLRQNAVFLVQENASRHLAAHPGFRDLYRASTNGTGFTDAPQLQQIPLTYTRKTGGAFIDFGVHWFHAAPLQDTAAAVSAHYGTLQLRARWKVEGGYTCGAVLAVSPGAEGPFVAQTADSGRDTTTSATWADLSLDVPLSDAFVREASMIPAAGAAGTVDIYQRGVVRMGRIFAGFYCSSNTNSAGSRASVVNISLRLSGG